MTRPIGKKNSKRRLLFDSKIMGDLILIMIKQGKLDPNTLPKDHERLPKSKQMVEFQLSEITILKESISAGSDHTSINSIPKIIMVWKDDIGQTKVRTDLCLFSSSSFVEYHMGIQSKFSFQFGKVNFVN